MKRLIVCTVLASVVAGLGNVAQAKGTPVKPETVFPKTVFGKVDAECITDPKRDWSFFNGEPAGRHDRYVDITGLCINGRFAVDKLPPEKFLEGVACGETEEVLVGCSPSTAPFGPEDLPLVLVGMKLNGAVPRDIPPDETGRVQVFLQAKGDPATRTPASPQAPNLSAVDSNFSYQQVFNAPGPNEPPSQLLAIDNRTAEQFLRASRARVWIRGSTVVFIIPANETGPVTGVRGAVFWGSRDATGDASQGNQDVVPGKANGKSYDFSTLTTRSGAPPEDWWP